MRAKVKFQGQWRLEVAKGGLHARAIMVTNLVSGGDRLLAEKACDSLVSLLPTVFYFYRQFDSAPGIQN